MMGFRAAIKSSRVVLSAGASLAVVFLAAGSARAVTYTSGDVFYVAYQSPTGPNYIVNLGSKDQFLNAVTTISFPDVLASDLNGVIGAAAPNIWVGLFGVRNPASRDGILSANGPQNDTDLSTANILGAANQIDSFGGGVVNFSLAVPSGNAHAGKFTSSGSTGSYQSTLDAVNKGSLGNNIAWDVETSLSNGSGIRIGAAVKIAFYSAQRNPFTGLSSRQVIGFFTLNPDGTLTYSPDVDGDFIADQSDLCPGIYNFGDNTDADGDGRAPACDCNPTNGSVWSIPGEATALAFTSTTNFGWTAPSNPGGTGPLYDVIQATQGPNVGIAPSYACFQPDLPGVSSSDAAVPALSRAFFYLVRAGNVCGEGTAGVDSGNVTRVVPACP